MNTFCICKAQQIGGFKLEKLIYHASRCNGICPEIDLQIDSNRQVYVSREFYKTKSEIDRRYSGQFISTLKEADYEKLITLLQAFNLDTLAFPDINCCDLPIKTLIVYSNGKRHYYKSMEPPSAVYNLLAFLKVLGTNKELSITSNRKTLEE